MVRNMNRETLEQKIAKIEKAISRKREQYDRLIERNWKSCIKRKKRVPNGPYPERIYLNRKR